LINMMENKHKSNKSEIGDEETQSAISEQDEQLSKDAVQEEKEVLRHELEGASAKADEYLEGWQRARAEFSNYKKRVEREQSQTFQIAAGKIFKRYLEVIDDLDRALKNSPKEGDGAVWADGIELVYRKMISIMENEGVSIMETDGKEFDPNLHEAVSSEESDEHESGEIIETLQKGYLIGDRVLRPAMVRVAR
jgi:molecular chaperone GrpE